MGDTWVTGHRILLQHSHGGSCRVPDVLHASWKQDMFSEFWRRKVLKSDCSNAEKERED